MTTLTYNLQSPANYGHGLLKLNDNGQLIPKIEWKQTDGVGQTDKGDCNTSLSNVACKYFFKDNDCNN